MEIIDFAGRVSIVLLSLAGFAFAPSVVPGPYRQQASHHGYLKRIAVAFSRVILNLGCFAKYAAVVLKKITFLFCLRLLTFQTSGFFISRVTLARNPGFSRLAEFLDPAQQHIAINGKVSGDYGIGDVGLQAKCIASCLCFFF